MRNTENPHSNARRRRVSLLIGTALAMAFPCVAMAQTASPATPSGQSAPESTSDGRSKTNIASAPEDTDIVVTAQKREERLLDVPVPVSAVSADTLKDQNLSTIREYFTRIPSLQYSNDYVSGLSIRGITTGGASNPTLAVLVDDVPFGSSLLAGQTNIPDFDPSVLQQIEVLRGPQGTLYGAASLGGLIKYVTKQPSLTDLGGQVELGANNVAYGGEGFSARGQVNVPIIRDRVALSVSGFYRRNPAWVDNINRVTGYRTEDANLSRSWGGRAALIIKPTDRVTISLSAIRQDDRISGSRGADFISPTDFSGVPEDYAVVRSSGQPSYSKFSVYSGKVDIDLGFGTLTSVSGWNTAITTPIQDLSSIFGGLLSLFYPGTKSTPLINAHHTDRFSQELRLAGTGKTVDWLIGGFYSNERSAITQTLTAVNASGGTIATPYFSSGPTTYREYAAFGSLTGHLTDRFDLQIGGRYAKNRFFNTGITTIDPPIVPVFGPSSLTTARQSDQVFTWLVSPSWKLNDNVLVYARVANGYRPGGTNDVIAGIPHTYNGDRVINYEVGTKGTAFDKRLEFDVSVFQINWKDIQLLNTDAVSQFGFTANGGRARSRGIELDGSLRLWKGGTLGANASLTDATLIENLPLYASATGLVGRSGDRLPDSAKFAGNVSLDQVIRLRAGTAISVGANYSYLGNRYSDFVNSDPSATGIRIKVPAYGQLDLRAGLQIDGGWRLNVYARNVLNTRGVVSANDRGGTSSLTGGFIQPRTVGFLVSGSF